MSRQRGFRTRDSALSYFINQLDNLDKRLYEPLVSVSWGRDIKLRPGITMSNESTSFIRSAFAAAGSLANPAGSAGGNMPWVSAETNAIPGVSVNGERIITPLRLLAREVSYTSVELDRSQNTGQSIDAQKMDAFNTLLQMNTDQMVYVGSADVGAKGLLNSSLVTTGSVATGASGSTEWEDKTPTEILADVNALLESCWLASGYAVCPSSLRLPPLQFSSVASRLISSAGSISILKFLQDNSIANNINGRPLDIQSIKWLPGLGVDSTDRMMVYTNELDRVRFPMVPVRREVAYYQGIRFIAPYLWAFGEVEFVYPETVQYADGI